MLECIHREETDHRVYPLQRGLVKQCSLSALSGTRLGIDTTHYLRKLLRVREPLDTHDTFTPAIGGAPLTLTAEVRSAPALKPSASSVRSRRTGGRSFSMSRTATLILSTIGCADRE